MSCTLQKAASGCMFCTGLLVRNISLRFVQCTAYASVYNANIFVLYLSRRCSLQSFFFFSLLSLRLAGKAAHGCCSWHVSGSAWQSGATPLRTCERLGLQCLRFWLQHCSMVLNIPSSRHNDGSLFERYFLKVLVEFVDEDGDGNLNLSESFGCKKWARALLAPEVRYLRCWWWIWKAMRLRVPIFNFRLFCHQMTWKVHRSDQSDAHRHTSRSRGPAIHALRWWPEWLSGPLHAQHYTAYGHGGLHSYNVPCTVIICYITQCTIYFFFGLLCWRD